jgi:hypothetical protein
MSVRTAPRATLALVAGLSFLTTQAARAQGVVERQSAASSAPLVLTRLTAPVVVDGVPDDDAWSSIPALPLTEYTPVFRGTPTQRSVIKVAYDDENFYAAGWFFDSEPSKIRINSLYRDRWNGDDAFAIYIDPFNDNRNAKWFGTTPGGIRFDILISDDGRTTNGSWDTFWTTATTVTDSGWFAEVRIPFSSIGFQADANGMATMGLTVTRAISRLDERVTFPAIDPKFEFRRPSVAQDVVLQNVRSRKPVYVTPYVLAGSGQRSVADVNGGFRMDRRTSNEVGLDVKYPFTAGLTLDLTMNTDFAQVEADDQQVNLDRFPLYFPERRRFFQEGSGIFDFTAANGTLLFNSRRIGLSPDLEPVRVLGGARLVGRTGPWDIGFLDMQTAAHAETPSENFGVLRMRRRVLNPFSTAGFLLTSYSGARRHNEVVGADASLRVFGDYYLSPKLATSIDNTDNGSANLVGQSLGDLTFERRVQRGLQYQARVTRSGSGFDPELAFMPRRDFTTANVVGNWFFFANDRSIFRRIYPGALWFSTFRNANHTLESGMSAVWLEWDTKAGGGGWVEPKRFHESVTTPFTIGKGITIPAGNYDFADLQIALDMGSGARLRSGLDFRTGTYFDGRRTQAIVTPTWNVSPHLELGTDYQFTALRFASRGESENIQVARLRILGALDARRSGNAFIQYNSTSGHLDFNVRLRYAFAEGTDLWVVYNEGLGTDRLRDADGIRPPMSLARTMIVKYTRTVGF